MEPANPRDAVAEAARAIVAADGVEALANPRAFAGRIADRAPGTRREAKILQQALADSVLHRLKDAPANRQTLVRQLASQIEQAHGFQPELAAWAVALIDSLVHGEPAANAAPPSPVAAAPAGPEPAHNPPHKPGSAGAGAAVAQVIAVARPLANPAARIIETPAAATGVPSGTAAPARLPSVWIGIAFGLGLAILAVMANPLAMSPVVAGWAAYPEDALSSFLAALVFAAPVAGLAALGFRGSAALGGILAVAVLLFVHLGLGSDLESYGGILMTAGLFQAAAAAVAEAILLFWRKLRTGVAPMALAGATYAGLGGFALGMPWRASGLDGTVPGSVVGINVFALAGILAGGAIAGVIAALVIPPLLRRLPGRRA